MRYALILLAGCSGTVPTPLCESPCGMLVYAPPAEGFCEGLPELEARVNAALATVDDPRFQSACKREEGFVITQRMEGAWLEGGRMVRGLTYCDTKQIVIGARPIETSALAHEMVHAVQACQPLPPTNPSDPSHSNWGPIYQALIDAGLKG